MKALVSGLLVAGLVGLALFSGIASAVSFNLSYSDPASDVEKFWTSNNTPVLTSTGNITLSPFPATVDLIRIASANASANVTLTITVKGSISNLDNTSYQMRLYTRADNASHFMVTYVNGTTRLTSNATGFTSVDLSGNTVITGPNPNLKNTVQITVGKTLLGTITAWNIDATATQSGPVYTYRDFVWMLPGNPGSNPTPTPTPSILPSWIWLAIVPVVLAIVVVIVLVARRKKPAPPPQS